VVWGGARGNIIFHDIFMLDFGFFQQENEIDFSIDSEELQQEKTSSITLNNNFLSQIKSMYTQKLFCDVSFEVEGQQFQAHRGILAARSKYFTNMFNNS